MIFRAHPGPRFLRSQLAEISCFNIPVFELKVLIITIFLMSITVT